MQSEPHQAGADGPWRFAFFCASSAFLCSNRSETPQALRESNNGKRKTLGFAKENENSMISKRIVSIFRILLHNKQV